MHKKLFCINEIEKKADIFLDGKVISRNMKNNEGYKCSLGFVLPGEFEVTVEDSESVEVLGGDFVIMLPGSEEYIKCNPGDGFYIPKNETYKMIVYNHFDYYCVFGQ